MKITQLCSTICDPKDYTVYGILQARILELVAFPFSRDLPNPGIGPRSPTLKADSLPAEPQGSPRILEWVAYPFSRGSSQPRNYTRVSHIAGRFFTNCAIKKALTWKLTDNDIPAQANVKIRMCPPQHVNSEQREGAGPLGRGKADHH